MLTVIAIIGILAAIIIAVLPAVSGAKVRKSVQAQMQQMITVIDHYKEVKGFYPPDNPNNNAGTGYYMTSLYYELTAGQPMSVAPFGVAGVINTRSVSSDAKNFFPNVKENQYIEIDAGQQRLKVLGVRTRGPLAAPFDDFCPWQYRVAPSDTQDPSFHNPNSYDLWVEVLVNGERTKIGNWKEKE